jgi:hypothetical protein
MTRFSADSPKARRELFVDAIAAHRARESQFCTLEAARGKPWIQIGSDAGSDDSTGQSDSGSSEDVLNLDCTDEELDRLKNLLNEFPDFSVEDLASPETVHGTNVRIGTFADGGRIADFVERCFQTVYEQPEGYVVWTTEI